MAAASEPNLLKIRLKQSVIERKARAGSLAARRQERALLLAAQRRLKQHQSSLIGPSTYLADIQMPLIYQTGNRNSLKNITTCQKLMSCFLCNVFSCIVHI